MYSEIDIRRFSVAYELTNLGIPLRAVRALSNAARTTDETGEAAHELSLMLEDLAGTLRQQIARIDRMVSEIEFGRRILDGGVFEGGRSTFGERTSKPRTEVESPAILAFLENGRPDDDASHDRDDDTLDTDYGLILIRSG